MRVTSPFFCQFSTTSSSTTDQSALCKILVALMPIQFFPALQSPSFLFPSNRLVWQQSVHLCKNISHLDPNPTQSNFICPSTPSLCLGCSRAPLSPFRCDRPAWPRGEAAPPGDPSLMWRRVMYALGLAHVAIDEIQFSSFSETHECH